MKRKVALLLIYLFAVSGIIFNMPLVLRQYTGIWNLYPWVKFVRNSKLSHIDFHVIQHCSEIILV
jgi:hypothetical protein